MLGLHVCVYDFPITITGPIGLHQTGEGEGALIAIRPMFRICQCIH